MFQIQDSEEFINELLVINNGLNYDTFLDLQLDPSNLILLR